MVRIYRNNLLLNSIDRVDGTVIVADLQGLELLDDLDVSAANLSNIRADGLVCQNTTFDDATLQGADLYWFVGHNASFRRSNLGQCTFLGAGLREANFDFANLTGAKFLKSNVGGATDLSGSDLSRALSIESADFSGAVYDAKTKWPTNFDAQSKGATAI
jgi:uncharacterized protein YjbI with pentapeptide repeats